MKQKQAFALARFLVNCKSDFVSVAVAPAFNGDGYAVRLEDTNAGVILEQVHANNKSKVRALVVFAINGDI